MLPFAVDAEIFWLAEINVWSTVWRIGNYVLHSLRMVLLSRPEVPVGIGGEGSQLDLVVACEESLSSIPTSRSAGEAHSKNAAPYWSLPYIQVRNAVTKPLNIRRYLLASHLHSPVVPRFLVYSSLNPLTCLTGGRRQGGLLDDTGRYARPR